MSNGSKSGPRTYNKQANENYRNNNFWNKKPKTVKSIPFSDKWFLQEASRSNVWDSVKPKESKKDD